MKNLVVILALLVSSFGYSTDWISSLQDAKKIALASNKLIIIDFTAIWCGPCKKMERDTWQSPEMQSLLKNFVMVRVDIDANMPIAQQYSVNGIPYIVIADGSGMEIKSFSGYKSVKDLTAELQYFARSTEPISSELSSYCSAQTYQSSVNLSQAYFDYALEANPSVKKALVNMGTYYLGKAKANLSKKDANFAVNSQKIKILEMYEMAYLGNYQKLAKKISDIKSSEVLPENMGSYYFLKYVSAKATKSADLQQIEEQAKIDPAMETQFKKADNLLASNP